MPRHARLDAPGTLHHIIIRGIEGRRIVDDRKDRRNFLNHLERVISETDTSVYAWALMPNHAHFLLRSMSVPDPMAVAMAVVTGCSTLIKRKK